MPTLQSSPAPNRISLFRGDDHTVEVTVKKKDPTDPTGKKLVVVDLSGGVTPKLTVKTRAADATILKQVTGTVVNPPGTDGKIRFEFVPADTATWKPGLYPYDVQITMAGPKTYTILKDQFEVKEDVTT